MKIESLHIENLRAFKDETIVFDDYTCFVGANGSGKSTILCALNILFRETADAVLNLQNLEKEDFHNQDTSQPIKITAVFCDLNEEAQKDFSDYFRNDKLVIMAKAEFDNERQLATVTQHGEREGINEFRVFFKAESEKEKVAELKKIYEDIKNQYQKLPVPGSKAAMIEALRNYEETHRDECALIPSDDKFYGFSGGANRLAKHIQWIYIPAVKDVTNEQLEAKNTALEKLLARTVRAKINFEAPIKKLEEDTKTEYSKILETHQSALDDISQSLQQRITEWAHPDASLKLEWQQDLQKVVKLDEPYAQIVAGEGAFSGNIARFGHGLQRSFLLAILHELSLSDTENTPTLILGCEEPELYQHPPQVKHLSNVLQQISGNNSQIIVTTHNPSFIFGKGFENVRLVRKNSAQSSSSIKHTTFQNTAKIASELLGDKYQDTQGIIAKIHQELQPSINEMFFTNKVVLVEGLEDISYIVTYLNLLDLYNEFRKQGISIVPTNGKGHMILPLIIARQMEIPTFIVFDSDKHKIERPNTNEGIRNFHEKDNKALLSIMECESPIDPFPNENYWGDNVVMWKSEIGDIVKSDIGRNWETCANKTRLTYGNAGGLEKNSLYIADVLNEAWNNDSKSSNLTKLCEEIIKFGST